MICPNCGAPLSIEDEKCPYCGQENPYGKQQRKDMKHFQKEFRETQNEVRTHVHRFSKKMVSITIIFVLIVLNLAGGFFAKHAWDFAADKNRQEIIRNLDTHKEKLEQYLKDGDYQAFHIYFDANHLYMVDEMDSYYVLSSVTNVYWMAFSQLVYNQKHWEETEIDREVTFMVNQLDYLFNLQKNYGYRQEQLQGENLKHIKRIQEQIKALLVQYGGLTIEEAEQLPEYSAIRQGEILERGFRKVYEQRQMD